MNTVKIANPPVAQPARPSPPSVMAPLGSRKAPKAEIYYPESDGKPMGETDWHISVIIYLREALRYAFRADEQVYVAADMLFYYVEGKPRIFKVPDVFVVKGIARYDRRIYKLWEEQVAPCVIFEITSRDTRDEDVGAKRVLYEQLGVKEYFLFDPLGEYLQPSLQGFRLEGHFYAPIPLLADGTLVSAELGLILRPDKTMLRLVDPSTRLVIPTATEAMMQAQVQAQRAQAEAQRADHAEAELAGLRAQLARLQAQARGAADASPDHKTG
ncbi:Uma2 family endonuclease [Candidatus Amarolinea aalborgensis]|uniref:Uma2 family endonuclease n=1 Tax=Candidatus Amarolinea aalborgensis TaxID=2249329 RepID=UPI003BF9864F